MRMKKRPLWAIPGVFKPDYLDRWRFVWVGWFATFTIMVYRLGFIRAREAERITWSNFTWDFSAVQAERWQEAYEQGISRGRVLQRKETVAAAEDFFTQRRRERELENQDGG